MAEKRSEKPISALQRRKTALEKALTRSVSAYDQLVRPDNLTDPLESGTKILKQRRTLGFLVQALVNTEIDMAKALAEANAFPVGLKEFEDHMRRVQGESQTDLDSGRLPTWMTPPKEEPESDGERKLSGTIKLPPFVPKKGEQAAIKPEKPREVVSAQKEEIKIVFQLDGTVVINEKVVELDAEERVVLEEILRRSGRSVNTDQLIGLVKKVKRYKKGHSPAISAITARLRAKLGDVLPIELPGMGKKKYRMKRGVIVTYEDGEKKTSAQKEAELRKSLLRETLKRLLTDDLNTSTEEVLKELLQGKYATPQIAYFALLKVTEFYLNIKKKDKKEDIDPEDRALAESLDAFIQAKQMDVGRFKNWLKLRLGLKVKEEERPPISEGLESLVPSIEEVAVLALAINSLTVEELEKLDMQPLSESTLDDLKAQAAPLLKKVLDDKGSKEHARYVETLRNVGVEKLRQIKEKAKLGEILNMPGLNESVGLFLIELEYLDNQQIGTFTELIQTLGIRQITVDRESIIINVDRPSSFRDLMASFNSHSNEAQAKARKLLQAESALNKRIGRGIRPLIEEDVDRLTDKEWKRKQPENIDETIVMNTAELTSLSRKLGNLTESVVDEIGQKRLLASPSTRHGKHGYTFRDLLIMQCYVFARDRGGLSQKEVKFLLSEDLETIYQQTLQKLQRQRNKKA